MPARPQSFAWLGVIACLTGPFALGQEPVPVGDGSYASSIPPGPTEFWAGETVNVKRWHDTVPLFLAPGVEPPIPTNKWWSPLLFHDNVKTSHVLWAHPLAVSVQKAGVGVHYPTAWSGPHGAYQETFFLDNPPPLVVGGRGFTPTRQDVTGWGDWTVSFRLAGDGQAIDVTTGHGMPLVWLEYGAAAVPKVLAADATFFGSDGAAVRLPYKGDCLGVEWQGRTYGLFAPDDTTFESAEGGVELAIPSARRYVVVAGLPAKDRLAAFRKHAFAVPRATRVSWTYDPDAGSLATTWDVDTEPLKGDARSVLQGWIPHHYRGTRTDLAFTGDEYLSARGRLKCAAGNRFRIEYEVRGLLSHLPEPEAESFDRGRMAGLLDAFATWNHPFNPETYAGGKQVAMFARQIACAAPLQHPKLPTLVAKLRGELADVLTYTVGEPHKFFGFSPRFGGLIGFQCGFGSHRFNDQHFHYGYTVYASGILAMHDADFAARYGPMARLVAKTYANWDRDDRRFPFLRTFDVWEGHSWASGGPDNSPWFGENQESSSEAMMSWAAVATLGNALDDDAMTAAGIFGYVSESAATNEYWFNRHGDNFPPGYGPPGTISCITWGSQIQYITYFGPEPILVHGIQYLPILPSSGYLVRDPAAAATEFALLLERSGSDRYTRFKTRDTWEPLWAAEAMRYAALFDPAWASAWFEQLWQARDARATDGWEAGLTYFTIEAWKGLGRIDRETWIAAPDSAVFLDAATGRHTYFAANPAAEPRSFAVYRRGEKIGTLPVPARGFASTHELDGNLPPAVALVAPAAGGVGNTADVVLEATASDADGSVAAVEFFDGTTLLGAATAAPYSLRVSGLADGTHAFFARARDDKGRTATSAPVGFTCDIPAADIPLATGTRDFSARISGKANPTITFVPGRPIAGCGYVDVLVRLNGRDAGAYRMTKDGDVFTQRITAARGDKLECSFTYQTPPTGERNTHATPAAATVGVSAAP